VDGRSRPVYRGLYFNLERDEDVEILGWLLAIPRSRRTRAIKALLRAGLSTYAAARYPGVTPLPPDTVRALLGTSGRRRSRVHGAPSTPATPSRAPCTEGVLAQARPEPDTDPTPGTAPIDARVAAEAKLDRLLRSYGR
jgi:hypothetical protein